MLLPFLNCFPLTLLLFWEVSIQKKIGFQRPTKLLALTFMLLHQLSITVHYMMTNYLAIIYIIIAQELFYQFSFLSICFLFCRNSSKLLPQRKSYLKTLKIIGITSVVFYVIVFVLQLSGDIVNDSDIFGSCKTVLFMLFTAIQLPISLLFIVAGFIIHRIIRKYQPVTEYEKFMHRMQKKKSMRQLWICIWTFTIQIIYNFIYSLSLYTFALQCTEVTESKVFNNILWFVSRGVENVFWVYPFLYVFWPRNQSITTEQF